MLSASVSSLNTSLSSSFSSSFATKNTSSSKLNLSAWFLDNENNDNDNDNDNDNEASSSYHNASLSLFSSSFATRTKSSRNLNLSVRFLDDEDNDNDNSTFSQRSAWKLSPLQTLLKSKDEPPSFVTRRSSNVLFFDSKELVGVCDGDDDDINDDVDNADNEDYTYTDYYEDFIIAEGKQEQLQQQLQMSTSQLSQQSQRSAWKSSSLNSAAPPSLVERKATMEQSKFIEAALEVARLFDDEIDHGDDNHDNDDDDDDTDDVQSTCRSSLLFYPASKGDVPPSFVTRKLSNDNLSLIDRNGNGARDCNNNHKDLIFEGEA